MENYKFLNADIFSNKILKEVLKDEHDNYKKNPLPIEHEIDIFICVMIIIEEVFEQKVNWMKCFNAVHERSELNIFTSSDKFSQNELFKGHIAPIEQKIATIKQKTATIAIVPPAVSATMGGGIRTVGRTLWTGVVTLFDVGLLVQQFYVILPSVLEDHTGNWKMAILIGAVAYFNISKAKRSLDNIKLVGQWCRAFIDRFLCNSEEEANTHTTRIGWLAGQIHENAIFPDEIDIMGEYLRPVHNSREDICGVVNLQTQKLKHKFKVKWNEYFGNYVEAEYTEDKIKLTKKILSDEDDNLFDKLINIVVFLICNLLVSSNTAVVLIKNFIFAGICFTGQDIPNALRSISHTTIIEYVSKTIRNTMELIGAANSMNDNKLNLISTLLITLVVAIITYFTYTIQFRSQTEKIKGWRRYMIGTIAWIELHKYFANAERGRRGGSNPLIERIEQFTTIPSTLQGFLDQVDEGEKKKMIYLIKRTQDPEDIVRGGARRLAIMYVPKRRTSQSHRRGGVRGRSARGLKIWKTRKARGGAKKVVPRQKKSRSRRRTRCDDKD
jgi:hypothetical protein